MTAIRFMDAELPMRMQHWKETHEQQQITQYAILCDILCELQRDLQTLSNRMDNGGVPATNCSQP